MWRMDCMIEKKIILIFYAAHYSLVWCYQFSLQKMKKKTWVDFPQQIGSWRIGMPGGNILQKYTKHKILILYKQVLNCIFDLWAWAQKTPWASGSISWNPNHLNSLPHCSFVKEIFYSIVMCFWLFFFFFPIKYFYDSNLMAAQLRSKKIFLNDRTRWSVDFK